MNHVTEKRHAGISCIVAVAVQQRRSYELNPIGEAGMVLLCPVRHLKRSMQYQSTLGDIIHHPPTLTVCVGASYNTRRPCYRREKWQNLRKVMEKSTKVIGHFNVFPHCICSIIY